MSSETHAHRLAKNLMVSWLRAAAEAAGRDEYAKCAGLSWRVNRGPPHWGVWLEYPFLAEEYRMVWDERGPFTRDESGPFTGGWDPSIEESPWELRPPTFDELVCAGMPPKAIVDIAIQHKGLITNVIEIVHKHPCSAEKRRFLQENVFCGVIEIPAAWVLGQIGVPAKIPDEFFMSTRAR